MSSTLTWKPVRTSSGDLDTQLKLLLRKHFGDATINEIEVGSELIPYLTGLRDAGVEDADKLIKLIKKHGTIELNEEF